MSVSIAEVAIHRPGNAHASGASPSSPDFHRRGRSRPAGCGRAVSAQHWADTAVNRRHAAPEPQVNRRDAAPGPLIDRRHAAPGLQVKPGATLRRSCGYRRHAAPIWPEIAGELVQPEPELERIELVS